MSVRQLRPAGVNPSRQPIRADIGGRFGKLPNQNGGGLVVKSIVVLIVVGVRFSGDVGIAIREQNRLEPAVRAETYLEGMVRRIIDERGVVWPQRKKGRIAVDQHGPKSFVDTNL